MSKNEFEKDLHEYLRTRKKAGFSIKSLIKDILPKPKPKTEIPTEVEVYTEEAPKEPKQPILQRIFKKDSTEELLQAKMQAEDAISDVKEMAKITLSMIKKLPDEQLKAIKSTEEFEKMKTILKKHELIK